MNSNRNNAATSRDLQLEQELNGLRNQYESLKEQKVRTEQDIANLGTQLESLKGQAQAEYGTSDIKELQTLLDEKRQENERVVAEYREHIQKVQSDLAAVENSFAGER